VEVGGTGVTSVTGDEQDVMPRMMNVAKRRTRIVLNMNDSFRNDYKFKSVFGAGEAYASHSVIGAEKDAPYSVFYWQNQYLFINYTIGNLFLVP
jgi:hypothetical protein